MNAQSKHRLVSVGLVILTFAFFMVFFTKIHPIVLFDTDSWLYAYYHRDPWPIWHFWNPTRVFPEVFMPAVSQFCAHIIYPMTGDYFFSLTIGYAASVSAGVTLLTWLLYRYFRRAGSGPFECAALTLLFLICHFLILRSADRNNRYMLLTENTCTHFYYVLPNLLNCALVLWLMEDSELNRLFAPGHRVKKSVFLLLMYFCVFSNLWSSMISGIYAGTTLLMGLISVSKGKKHWFRNFLRNHSTLILLLVLWALAQWFEFNGRRANQVKNLDFRQTLRPTIDAALPVLASVSDTFRWMAAILLAGGLGVSIWKRRWDGMMPALVGLVAALLIAVYLVLSCAVCEPLYITRPDTFYGLFFFVMLVLLVSLRQMMRHLAWLKALAPLCLVILALECNTDDITYRNSMYFNLPASACYQVDNDILQQLQSAVEEGKSKTVLYVPVFNTDNNWPLATSKSVRNRFPTHLYKMGVLEKNIKVSKVLPTEEKNKEFNIG